MDLDTAMAINANPKIATVLQYGAFVTIFIGVGLAIFGEVLLAIAVVVGGIFEYQLGQYRAAIGRLQAEVKNIRK